MTPQATLWMQSKLGFRVRIRGHKSTPEVKNLTVEALNGYQGSVQSRRWQLRGPAGSPLHLVSPVPLHSTTRLLLSRSTCFFSSSKNSPFSHRPHVLATRAHATTAVIIGDTVHRDTNSARTLFTREHVQGSTKLPTVYP